MFEDGYDSVKKTFFKFPKKMELAKYKSIQQQKDIINW